MDVKKELLYEHDTFFPNSNPDEDVAVTKDDQLDIIAELPISLSVYILSFLNGETLMVAAQVSLDWLTIIRYNVLLRPKVDGLFATKFWAESYFSCINRLLHVGEQNLWNSGVPLPTTESEVQNVSADFAWEAGGIINIDGSYFNCSGIGNSDSNDGSGRRKRRRRKHLEDTSTKGTFNKRMKRIVLWSETEEVATNFSLLFGNPETW